MTVQAGHLFSYEKSNYSIAKTTNSILFDPKDYGIIPFPRCTACHRGYWCGFSIADRKFILDDLFINTEDNVYPTISGVHAVTENNRALYMGHHIYRGLHIPLDYTGRILAGNNAIPTYYIEGLFDNPWCYKNLKEFVFDKGILVDVIEQSETAKDIRKMIQAMSKTQPKRSGIMGRYVEISLGALKLISNNAWWLERY